MRLWIPESPRWLMTHGQVRRAEAIVAEIEGDLQQGVPMLRLLQGDVGSGKTLVALMAMLTAVDPGDEVIIFEPYYGYHINTLLAVEAVPT